MNELHYTDRNGRRFGLGLIPSTREERRRVGAFYAGPNIPRENWAPVDFTPYIPEIYNQGEQSSCVGHGGVGVLGTIRAMHGQGTERLSPSHLYGRINGGSDRGALVTDALTELQKGVCLEATVGPGKWQPRQWPANAADEGKRFRIEKAVEIRGFDAIVTALHEGDPVCFGIFLGNRFEPDKNGILPQWDGRQSGGHCMYAAGVLRLDKWRLIVPNSWGRQFGKDGIGYLDESYFNGWHEAWRLKVAAEDPEGDAPPAVKVN